MELKPFNLTEFHQQLLESRDKAQARLKAAGETATFADRAFLLSAQSQLEYIEEALADNEPLPFEERDKEQSSPHLMESVVERSAHTTNGNSAKPTALNAETKAHVGI